MQVYLVCTDHEYDGIQDILAVYSERRMAEEFIEDYNKNDSIKAARGEELRKMCDDYYLIELVKMGLTPEMSEFSKLPWEQADKIDEAFRNTLSEDDQECIDYFAKSATETLIVMERELL